MKAVMSRFVGGPDTLTFEDIGEPELTPGSVLVSIRAIGVNYLDLLIIEDRYQFWPQRPFSPGAEISGVIEAVGEGVSLHKPGDRVLAFIGWGGMVEKAVIEADLCFKIPDSMPFEDAAAFLLAYGTSYYALADRASLQPGETLLVLGASGGTGSAAVELGKAMGSRVLAAASSNEKLEAALEAGAENGLIYPVGPLDAAAQKDLSGRFKVLCGHDGANVIYDPVGGDYADPALRAIAWQGRYLVVGFSAGIPKMPLNLPLLKACDIRGVFWGAATARDPERHRQAVAELFEFYRQGAIKPRIDGLYPLQDAVLALQSLAGRQVRGKAVLTLS